MGKRSWEYGEGATSAPDYIMYYCFWYSTKKERKSPERMGGRRETLGLIVSTDSKDRDVEFPFLDLSHLHFEVLLALKHRLSTVSLCSLQLLAAERGVCAPCLGSSRGLHAVRL